MIMGMMAAQMRAAPVVGPTAHRYWRLLISRSAGGSIVSIAEVEFRATAGGANQCRGGTPIASSSYSIYFDVSAAFDGAAVSQWGVIGVPGVWIGYAFASAVSVTEVTVKDDIGTFAGSAGALDFKVQHSDDGSAWSDDWSCTSVSSGTSGAVRVYTKP